MSARRAGSRRAGSRRAAPAATSGRFRSLTLWLVVVLVSGVTAWVGAAAMVRRTHAARLPDPPDRLHLSDAIARQITDANDAARAEPTSPARVGDLGLTYHASLLNSHADRAYSLAERLAPGEWQWPYLRGLLYEERGDHDAAAAAFARVTAIAPGHGLAWFHIAEIAFKQGRLDLAEQAYRRAREAPPDASPSAPGLPSRSSLALAAYADFGLTRIALERGQPAEARNRLAALVRTHPGYGPARRLLVQLDQVTSGAAGPAPAIDAGRTYVPPADPLVDAIVARSLHTDLLLKHAALAARGGDRAWREFLARRALAANPRGLDVLLEMASMLQAAGRHDEALEFLRQCEQVAPGDHHALVEQGKSLSEVGRLDEAEQVLRRAIRVRDAAAEYNLATVLDRQDRWDQARQHYERALAIDPFHARAMNNLAVGFDRRGRAGDALVLYARSLQAAPDNAETYSNLGSALMGLRRFGEALRALETAVALDPDAPDAHNNLGIALAQSGRLADARAQFETALRLDPRHPNARRNLEAIK